VLRTTRRLVVSYFHSLPVRTRLTIWYVIVLGTVLCLFIAGTGFVLHWQLVRQLNHFAVQDIETIEGLLYFGPDGIRLGYGQTGISVRLREFVVAALTLLPFLLGITALFGYQLARRTLSPLEQMALRAERITAEHLDQRLPVVNAEDELGHLARVINGVLDRLEQSFEQLRRFTSDASHELRTPLVAIRSVGEVALQKTRRRLTMKTPSAAPSALAREMRPRLPSRAMAVTPVNPCCTVG
jgi:signal transduction histidine kinase